MKREDLKLVIGGDFMLYAHNDANPIEEGISEAQDLRFAEMFNKKYSHFEHTVAITATGVDVLTDGR